MVAVAILALLYMCPRQCSPKKGGGGGGVQLATEIRGKLPGKGEGKQNQRSDALNSLAPGH